MIYKKRTD